MPAFLLSLTATINQVANGNLTDQDLDQAIFCFGCGQTWPFEKPENILKQHRTGPEARQDESATPVHVAKVAAALKRAQTDGRAVWRIDSQAKSRNGHVVHREISEVLEKLGLFRLNPNLPPILGNNFLQTAIERVDKTRSIRVVA